MPTPQTPTPTPCTCHRKGSTDDAPFECTLETMDASNYFHWALGLPADLQHAGAQFTRDTPGCYVTYTVAEGLSPDAKHPFGTGNGVSVRRADGAVAVQVTGTVSRQAVADLAAILEADGITPADVKITP